MTNHSALAMSRPAAAFLLLGSLACFLGASMYVAGERRSWVGINYHTWERGFIVAAPILTAIGFMLLEDLFDAPDSRALARIGSTGYFFGAILVVAAELLAFSLGWEEASVLIPTYVVMAYLAEASIGAALLRSRIVAPWIGWSTIVWNLGWLLALPIFGWVAGYIPLVHHLMPLIIGIGFWRRAR